MNQLTLTLRSVLHRIASTSPRHIRITERTYTEDGKKAKTHKAMGLVSDWVTPESHLVWSIYERAVYDHFGIGTGNHGFGRNPVFRNETARTGMISLSTGKPMNILELLGIDPEWAHTQIKAALRYHETMPIAQADNHKKMAA